VSGQADVPRFMQAFRLPPGVSIRVDGRLDEDVWQEAPSYADWVQKEPVEGAPAINDARVRLLYDDNALYVGVINYDSDPASIARNMARRDAAYAGRSDYFEVMIDPNGDRRTAYRFRVTAGGVQTDRYLYDDDKEDPAWDAVYESPVTIDERGWIAEFRIPLSQIRYETADTAQTWGIQFGRRRAADNELTRFSFVSKLRPGRVSQFGRVTGLLLRSSPRRLEALPYVVSQAHRGQVVAGNPFFDGSDAQARAGVDLSYGVGTAFTLDGTLNPDFGQVEADPAVVNLTAFETFFQERRPFFVEDARVFDYSLGGGQSSLFYSRRIGRSPHGGDSGGADFVDVPVSTSILGALKLTGRTNGGLSLGALAALTQEEHGTGFFKASDEYRTFTVEPRTAYAVVRAQQDFRDGQSRIGGIMTAARRSLPQSGEFDDLPDGAYSLGLDFEHTWGNREWALWGFFSGSHVAGDSTAITRIQRASNHYRQRPDLEWSALDSSATSMTGANWRLQFERRVGHWTGAVWAAEITSGFEVNDLGFSTDPERLDGGFRVGFQEVRPNRLFHFSKVDFTTAHNFSHEALRDAWSLDSWRNAHTAGSARISGSGEFVNFWTGNFGITYTPDLMSRTDTRGGPRMRSPGGVELSLGFGTDNRKFLSLQPKVGLTRRRDGAGRGYEAGMAMTIQPSTRVIVTMEPSYKSSSNGSQYVIASKAVPFQPTYGTRYLFGDLDRRDLSMVARVNWTFSPRLSLELFAQPLVSSGDFVTYKQLRAPGSYDFDVFKEGVANGTGCSGGRTCRDSTNLRFVDFDGDGVSDLSFTDRDFNVRSLRSTAVVRWEYRPGSALFFVWQHRQADEAAFGDFIAGRDLRALVDAPSDDVFIIKANIWLSW
jgi:Domain of unknown function (DUF5916)/Carbohydrate family 9 binding domain-like